MKQFIFIVLALVAFANAEQRIVGGQFAELAEFPHQIALLKNDRFSCGGSILTEQYVLTAAHCVYSDFGLVEPKDLTVVHGTNYFPNGTKVEVTKVIAHENYGDFKNDIALLKLAKPLTFDEYTKAISLRKRPVPAGAKVVISGFGRTAWEDPVSETLKYNEMTVLSQQDCGSQTGIVYDGLICFNAEEENGACKGDSGGPAVFEGELVGVANFVIDGCGSSNPDGYAKVSYFIDWLHKHIKKPVLMYL